MSFNLLDNPFAILGVDIDACDAELDRAYQQRLLDGAVDESRLLRARQALAAPKPRLEAELGWLVGLETRIARVLVQGLRDGTTQLETVPSAASLVADEVCMGGPATAVINTALARANLAAHLCTAGRSQAIGSLLECAAQVDSRVVADAIGAARAAAGRVGVDESKVVAGLAELRARHAAAAAKALVGASDPAAEMTALVIGHRRTAGGARTLLEALTRQYRRHVGPELERLEQSLGELADDIAARAAVEANVALPVAALVARLAEWDRLAQPLQLLDEAKSLDESQSSRLFGKLRSLAVDLANDHGAYQTALDLTEALLKHLGELPSASERLKEDREALQALLRSRQLDQARVDLQKSADVARADLRRFAGEIRQGGFAASGSGSAGALYRAFAAAAAATAGTEAASAPWLVVRSLAIELHNELRETDAAFALVHTLMAFRATVSPSDVRVRLAQDEAELRRQGATAAMVPGAPKAQAPKQALFHDRDLPQQPVAAKSKATRASIGWIVAAVVVIGIIGAGRQRPTPEARAPAAVAKSMPAASQPAPSRSVAPSNPTSTPEPRQPVRSVVPATERSGLEPRRPGATAGSAFTLPASEILWCLMQSAVLDTARARLDSGVAPDGSVGRFNERVEDYNPRCGSFNYRQSDMEQAKREMAARGAEIEAEAAQIIGAKLSEPSRHPETSQLHSRGSLSVTRRDDARRIQDRLRELGFDPGPSDGKWGTRSQAALDALRGSLGLTPGGGLDATTLRALFPATSR